MVRGLGFGETKRGSRRDRDRDTVTRRTGHAECERGHEALARGVEVDQERHALTAAEIGGIERRGRAWVAVAVSVAADAVAVKAHVQRVVWIVPRGQRELETQRRQRKQKTKEQKTRCSIGRAIGPRASHRHSRERAKRHHER